MRRIDRVKPTWPREVFLRKRRCHRPAGCMRSVHETFAASGAILRRTELKFAKEAVTGTYTRGEFLGFGAALAGAFTLGRLPGAEHAAAAAQPPAAPPVPGGEPDLIVVNARVLTSEPGVPRAEAFAVKNGRFTAVGSTSDVRNLA